ncbi:MAG: hypothetical protein U0871_29880 [Gemmataceae bacterium]
MRTAPAADATCRAMLQASSTNWPLLADGADSHRISTMAAVSAAGST